MRAARLEAIAALRLAGGVTPCLALLLAVPAALQEPIFLRESAQPLAWPAIYAVADLCALAVCLSSPRSGNRSAELSWAHGLGLLVACTLISGSLVGLGVAMDLAHGAVTPWGDLVAAAARFLFVWTPVCLFAAATAVGFGGASHRLLLIAIAFLMQVAIHPLAAPTDPARLDKLLAWALAILAAAATMPEPFLRRRRDTPLRLLP